MQPSPANTWELLSVNTKHSSKWLSESVNYIFMYFFPRFMQNSGLALIAVPLTLWKSRVLIHSMHTASCFSNKKRHQHLSAGLPGSFKGPGAQDALFLHRLCLLLIIILQALHNNPTCSAQQWDACGFSPAVIHDSCVFGGLSGVVWVSDCRSCWYTKDKAFKRAVQKSRWD